VTGLTLPPCPTPCDGDCDADCHEVHLLDCKRSHQPWACHDIRVAMAEYAARMIEQHARRPLPARLLAPVQYVGAGSRAAGGTGKGGEDGSGTGQQGGAA
jgi:hypothetical protein